MTAGEGAAGRCQTTGTADESTCTVILAEHADAGKQAMTSLADIAVQINLETVAAETHARSAMQHALAAGALLVQAKALVGHGEWQEWVKSNCTIAVRTASAYMRLVTKIESLPDPERQRVADLPVREAIRAISTSPDVPPSARGYVEYRRRDETTRTASTFKAGADALRRAARELEMNNRLKAQRAKSLRAELQAAIEALDALTRLGEMLKATPKHEGGRPAQKTGSVVEPVSSPPTLADLGIDKKVSK